MDNNVGSLTEAALKRKERLKRLQSGNESSENSTGIQSEVNLPKPLFRSYQPQDESLKENVLPKALPVSVEDQISNHLDAANPEPLIEEVNLVSLAPRKPDWDLKRDVSKKLEKLERRTQKAIITLIKERLLKHNDNESTNSESVDLADAVNYVETTQSQDSDED